MKAIILAAGKGTRLKNIAAETPKPMLIYKTKPILQYNIELCKKYGIDEIFINTHTFPEKIKDYFKDGKELGVHITYSYEDDLLGTSGALNNFRNEIGKDDFFVLYGDNYSDINLNLLKENFLKHNPIASIAFHFREDVSTSGVAEFDADGKILRFIEKPKQGETNSHWVNAGIYLLNNKILEFIPEGFSDFGKNIFPELINNKTLLYGVCFKTDVLAFDTPILYNRNVNPESL